jgi:D-tagatose-1,6-bisphosphate aldolase subunit GatZ/KbaZ
VLGFPRLVYEAHSTDYQTPGRLRQLVEDHFCILKVGPWLTFALREALFALEAIEKELAAATPQGPGAGLSEVRAALDRAMVERPEHWSSYYRGSAGEQRFKRAWSLSDRCRYYWPVPEVRQAVARLEANLRAAPIPPSLLSLHLGRQYRLVREGRLAPDPRTLAESRVREVLEVYDAACGLTGARD